jgi:hypothetical protein
MSQISSHKYKSGDIKAIRSLSKFTNVEEYKKYIDNFIYQYKHRISPTAYMIIKTIKHMTDFGVGVFTWTRKWMASKVERSVRMISKAISELREIGILTDIGEQTYHENDRRLGHNVWIIEKIELPEKKEFTPQCTPESSPPTEAEIPCESKAEEVKKDTQCSLSNSPSKELSNTVTTTLNVQYLNQYVPNDFYKKCKGFFQIEYVNDFWDTIIYTTSKHLFGKKWNKLKSYENKMILEIGLEAIDSLIKKVHSKKLHKSMGAYLHGTVKRISNKEKERIDGINQTIKEMDDLDVW